MGMPFFKKNIKTYAAECDELIELYEYQPTTLGMNE